MIIASTLFLIIGIVTFVVGVVASEDVGLIVVSIGASLLAAVTLAVGVVRDRRRLAAEGLEPSEPTMFTETPAEHAPIVRAEPEPLRPLREPEPAPVALAPEPEEELPLRESASVRAARSTAAKATAKTTAAKKPAAKKPAAKKTAAKKPAAKKPAAKKTAAKGAPKKATAKKTTAKAAPKKPAARKSTARKPAAPTGSPVEQPEEPGATPTDEG